MMHYGIQIRRYKAGKITIATNRVNISRIVKNFELYQARHYALPTLEKI